MSLTDQHQATGGNARIVITEALYEGIFRRFFAYLTKYTMGFGLDADPAKDLVVTVFVKLWQDRNKRSFSSEDEIKAFLRLCARNAAFNYIKAQKVEKKNLTMLASLDPGIQWPEDSPGRLEKKARTMAATVDAIYRAIESLPPQYKRVMQFTLEHKTVREIAAEMNLSEKTVYLYRQNAIKSLRKQFPGNIFALLLLLEISVRR